MQTLKTINLTKNSWLFGTLKTCKQALFAGLIFSCLFAYAIDEKERPAEPHPTDERCRGAITRDANPSEQNTAAQDSVSGSNPSSGQSAKPTQAEQSATNRGAAPNEQNTAAQDSVLGSNPPSGQSAKPTQAEQSAANRGAAPNEQNTAAQDSVSGSNPSSNQSAKPTQAEQSAANRDAAPREQSLLHPPSYWGLHSRLDQAGAPPSNQGSDPLAPSLFPQPRTTYNQAAKTAEYGSAAPSQGADVFYDFPANTPAYVFIRFAKSVLKQKWGTNSDWNHYTINRKMKNINRRITAKEAEELVEFLRNRLGDRGALNSLSKLSYLSAMDVKNKGRQMDLFHARLAIYERYLGETAVTKKLSQSLGGFITGKPPEDTDKLSRFLENWASSPLLPHRLMRHSLSEYSQITLQDIEPVIHFFTRHIGYPNTLSLILEGGIVQNPQTLLLKKEKTHISIQRIKLWGEILKPIISSNLIPAEPKTQADRDLEMNVQNGLISLAQRGHDDLRHIKYLVKSLAQVKGERFMIQFLSENLSVFLEASFLLFERNNHYRWRRPSDKKKKYEIIDQFILFVNRNYPSVFDSFPDFYNLKDQIQISRADIIKWLKEGKNIQEIAIENYLLEQTVIDILNKPDEAD